MNAHNHNHIKSLNDHLVFDIYSSFQTFVQSKNQKIKTVKGGVTAFIVVEYFRTFAFVQLSTAFLTIFSQIKW